MCDCYFRIMEHTYKKIYESLSPGILAKSIFPDTFQYPQHIAYLDLKLIELITGKTKRLIINMPPRHGKSEMVSKYLPFWYLGTFPDNRVILSSYESTFAQSWGRKVRNLIEEYGSEYFDIKMSDTSFAAGSFELDNHSGSMNCVGAGGSITGKGADLFIIDDPIKNDEDANSQTQRDKLWDWFVSTAYTRLEPNAAMVIMMTRWHEDDLCGRLIREMENGGEKWEILSIPALAHDNDPIGRDKNQALWESRFSHNHLLRIKRSLGSYWFDALYQQNPISLDGGIFNKKHFRYFYRSESSFVLINGEHKKVVNVSDCKFYSAMDLAISLSSSADYTCLVTVAISKDREIIVCDVVRRHLAPSEHIRMIEEVNHKFKPIIIGIESVQYQSALLNQAARAGYPVKALKPDMDKVTRALPAAALVESGLVFFDKDAAWLGDFENELIKFPRDKHDDQVDAFAYVTTFQSYNSGVMPVGLKYRSNLTT